MHIARKSKEKQFYEFKLIMHHIVSSILVVKSGMRPWRDSGIQILTFVEVYFFVRYLYCYRGDGATLAYIFKHTTAW